MRAAVGLKSNFREGVYAFASGQKITEILPTDKIRFVSKQYTANEITSKIRSCYLGFRGRDLFRRHRS